MHQDVQYSVSAVYSILWGFFYIAGTRFNHSVEAESSLAGLSVDWPLWPVWSLLLSRVWCCRPAGSWTRWGCSPPWPWCRSSSWARCGPARTEPSSTTSRGRTPRRLWLSSWSPATCWCRCWGASWSLCLRSLYPSFVSSKNNKGKCCESHHWNVHYCGQTVGKSIQTDVTQLGH